MFCRNKNYEILSTNKQWDCSYARRKRNTNDVNVHMTPNRKSVCIIVIRTSQAKEFSLVTVFMTCYAVA